MLEIYLRSHCHSIPKPPNDLFLSDYNMYSLFRLHPFYFGLSFVPSFFYTPFIAYLLWAPHLSIWSIQMVSSLFEEVVSTCICFYPLPISGLLSIMLMLCLLLSLFFFVSVSGDLKICHSMAHIELTVHYLNQSSSYIELNLAGLLKLRLVSLLMILVNSNPLRFLLEGLS